MNLSLRFDDNGTMHDDIVLRFGEQSWVCDSYYLALDRELLPEKEDAEKVKVVLRRLLELWLEAIQSMLSEGDTVFLPYDFSDQYTGWLSCQLSGSDVLVSRGWANVEGYSIYPSKVGEHISNLSGFHLDGPTVRATIEELVAAVRSSLVAVV